MHASVAEAWPTVAREHEGVMSHAYLDTVEKVTVGVGSLFDDGTGKPPDVFLALPWTVGGKPAPRAVNAASWLAVKARTDLAPRGGSAFRDVTAIRLDAQTITDLLMERTGQFWDILAATLPDLEQWPADAQLALLDLGYQLGPRFLGPRWPNFTAAAHAGDFAKCGDHSAVRQASPGRNERRERWFDNAALVVELDIDRKRLWLDETPKEDKMAYYVAPSLQQLLAEVNEQYPKRDKTSDGALGNASHQATKSDHNPDYDSGGVIRARDIDEDLQGSKTPYPHFNTGRGVDPVFREILERCRSGEEDRVEYLIYEGKIYRRKARFAAEDYDGVNAHDHHLHVSIRHGKAYENDRSLWLQDAWERASGADVWNVVLT